MGDSNGYWQTLEAVCQVPGITINELVERLNMASSTVTHHIRLMIGQGHIRGVRGGRNRNARSLYLTEQGQAVLGDPHQRKRIAGFGLELADQFRG